SAIDENLRYQAADPIANDDWRSFKVANDLLVMIGNVFQSKRCEAAWVAAKLFGAVFHAGPASGDDAIAFVRVVFNPVLPAERCHPEPGDEDDGRDVHCEKRGVRAS